MSDGAQRPQPVDGALCRRDSHIELVWYATTSTTVQSFTSKRLDQWAYLNGVELDFSRPGKPTDNAMIEAFNARLREECLNESRFLSLEDARERMESWRWHYNGERPHSALGNLAPETFALVATAGVQ